MDLKFGKYPPLTCIPSGIVDNVRLMLHYNPDTRPNLYELLKVEFQLILIKFIIDGDKNQNFNVIFISIHRFPTLMTLV